MASSFKRSGASSSTRASLLCNGSMKASGGAPEPSRNLMKTVAKKLESKKHKISFYVRGGGCRVGTCNELEAEECFPRRAPVAADRRSRKCSGKLRVEQQRPPVSVFSSLPDDVLEMILVRLPLASLMVARCVCQQWKCMMATPHFMQLRIEGTHGTPWIFLFGVSRDGCSAGEVQALDVSVDQWHRTGSDMLKGRSLFSVASVGTELYIVGGCYSEGDLRSSVRTVEGVLVFSPFSGSWCNAAPMISPRSTPVLGVSEISVNCNIFARGADRREQFKIKSRIGAASDVYEDPHRFSLRRQLRDAISETENAIVSRVHSSKPVGLKRGTSTKFVLIVVGGRGARDEHLDTGEIYDCNTNRWVEIARIPGDFGPVCSGAVCDGVFYVYSEAYRLAGYNIERGFWVTIQISRPPPCIRDYYPKLVSCEGRVFMLCVSWSDGDGQFNRRDNAVRNLWELDLALCSWKEVSRHPDAPMDWNAAFVADRDRVYGIEMFRIFGQVLDFLTACHVSDDEFKWMRVSRKNATHEGNASSCTTKSMAVLHL